MALGFGVPHVTIAAAASWGDLVGRFVYDGSPPERKKLKVDKDVDCCGKYDIRDESLMVGSDGGLANVFVYVRTRKVEVCPELAETAAKRVTLDNRDCIFMPHCMTIWFGKQEFYIVNSDPIAQNVAFSPLGDTPANIVLAAVKDTKDAKPDSNTSATWKFHRAQIIPVPIACNYHPWESAFVLPRENPYATVTAADGTFRLAKLPAGKLEFQVWHERIGYLDTPEWPKGRFEMEIKPGVNDLGAIKIAAARLEKK
jgi:hypothetical protein